MIRKIPNTWYVSICVPHQEKTGYYYSRHSQTFASESEAKQFAAAKIAAGVEVTAGTLNPVVPKRIVGPSEIEEWLSEEPAKSATGACKRVPINSLLVGPDLSLTNHGKFFLNLPSPVACKIVIALP